MIRAERRPEREVHVTPLRRRGASRGKDVREGGNAPPGVAAGVQWIPGADLSGPRGEEKAERVALGGAEEEGG